MINFCQKHIHMVPITLYFPTYLETLDQDIIYTVLIILSFQELYINFNQKLFFLLQIFLKNTNQEQYRLIHNYPFTKIWPILSKAYLFETALHFPKYLAKFEKKFNHGQYGFTQIVHLEKIDQFLWKYMFPFVPSILTKF